MVLNRNLSAPTAVGLFITDRCNLSCKHCCTNNPLEDEELTLHEMLDLFDEFKKANIFSVRLSGGEPFVRKDIFKILESLKEKKFQISISTNCTLIDDKILKKLKTIPFYQIKTSLDGSKKEIHEKLRGENTFDKTIDGIKSLTQDGFYVIAKSVVTKNNLKDLVNIASLAKKLGIKKVEFIFFRICGEGLKYKNELALTKENFSISKKIAKELSDKFGEFASGNFVNTYKKIENFKRLSPANNLNTSTIGICEAGTTDIAIRPDGIVIPCGALWDSKAGSIREKPLLEIWRNSPVLKQFREMNKFPLDSIEECKICEYKFFCNGGCRANAFYHSGSIFGKSPDCDYFR